MSVETLALPIRSIEARPAIARRPHPSARNANLDLLRAIAILAVVIFHVVSSAPTQIAWLTEVASYGKYGVDLFFVLSGWLIGGLYWREAATCGNVELPTFLLRRWLRTIPPYFVGLLLAWVAVRSFRNEPFDGGYLFFVQNYYPSMPFFSVSWSLCIEEHFYIVLPLALAILPQSRALYVWLFTALILSAPISRFVISAYVLDPTIGFANTATHLRMEGLLLGFFAARLPYYPVTWSKTTRLSSALFVPAIVALLGLTLLSRLWMYRIGLSVLAIGLLIVLIHFVQRPDYRIAKTRLVKWLALSSYSIYLTHALMVHVSQLAMKRVPALPEVAYYFIAFTTVAIAGAAFYFAVERTSIVLRDRVAPRPVRSNLISAIR